jgi:3-isopropylmalate dehydrogenase
MSRKIVVLAGDGVGPEVTTEAVRVLEQVSARHALKLEFENALIGGAAYDAVGSPLPDATVSACKASAGILLGAVGGPNWADIPVQHRPEQGLLAIRKALGLFANLRPVATNPDLAAASPLKAEKLKGVDILVIRELTGGIYFGKRSRSADSAFDTCEYSAAEIERVCRVAGKLAMGRRRKVTSVDKANVLDTSRLWRDFDVMVTENMFGDILTDEASMLAGSMGLLPSASLGDGSGPGLYEPIHGSAPDIAGQGVANPCGTILSAAMLLRHSCGAEAAAREIEAAIAGAIRSGARTRDIAAPGARDWLGTAAFTDVVLKNLAAH